MPLTSNWAWRVRVSSLRTVPWPHSRCSLVPLLPRSVRPCTFWEKSRRTPTCLWCGGGCAQLPKVKLEENSYRCESEGREEGESGAGSHSFISFGSLLQQQLLLRLIEPHPRPACFETDVLFAATVSERWVYIYICRERERERERVSLYSLCAARRQLLCVLLYIYLSDQAVRRWFPGEEWGTLLACRQKFACPHSFL